MVTVIEPHAVDRERTAEEELRELREVAGRAAHRLDDLLTILSACVETSDGPGSGGRLEALRGCVDGAAAVAEELIRVARPQSAATFPPPDPHECRPRRTDDGPTTVLIAEDEDGVREVTRAALQREGYEVLVAANAGDALRLMKEHSGPIHVLVSDLDMPDLWGTGLARRAAERRPGLRVLFISGRRDERLAEVAGGPVGFLPKPFTPQRLTRSVERLLEVGA